MKFLWGVATSSHQIEGGNTHNDWWAWEQAGNIETGETSGLATDHWHRFEEDLNHAASMGLNGYRFSIEWSRLEPQEGKWDKEAFGWYAHLLSRCEGLGIVPMVTLHHYTLPQWLAEKGGLTHPLFPDRFAAFVRKVAHHFGARIPLWCTVNEPMLLVMGGYMGSQMPPARPDPKLAAAAHFGLLKAHVAAYSILHQTISRREGPWKELPFAVGFAHNMIDFHPLRRWNFREWALTKVFHRYYNLSWLSAVTGRRQHFGVPGLMPAPKQVWAARGKKTIDFIGVNYYTKAYPCWGLQKQQNAEYIQFRNLPIGLCFRKQEDTVSDVGWPIHPEGLGKVIGVVSRYGLPIHITENGIADAKDVLRPSFLVEHLKQVAAAVEKGIDIRGYFHWSLLDNFEWVKGFTPRFGLYEVDYETFERRPRVSAQVYAELVAAHSTPQGQAPSVAVVAAVGARNPQDNEGLQEPPRAAWPR